MKNVNKKIAEIMEGRGYHKTTAYLDPSAWGQYEYVYLCRGVAMDRRGSYKESVKETAIWATSLHDFESVYALEKKDKTTGLFCTSEWSTDASIFDGMDGTVIKASVVTKRFEPVTLPVVAQVRDSRQKGKLWIDVVLDPQNTGENYRPGVYPDRSWKDVRAGYAVIEKVTHKSDTYAFVSGHMLDETYKISLDEFITRHQHDMYKIDGIRVHEYDYPTNTGVIEYWYDPICSNVHYVDYAVLNDDGATMKMSFRTLDDTPYKDRRDGIIVFPDEFKILSRFGFSSEAKLVEWLDDYYGAPGSLIPLMNLNLGDYDAFIPVKADELYYTSKSFKRAFDDGIISVRKTRADSDMQATWFCKGNLHKLYDYYNDEIDELTTTMREINWRYAESVKSLIKKGKIKVHF